MDCVKCGADMDSGERIDGGRIVCPACGEVAVLPEEQPGQQQTFMDEVKDNITKSLFSIPARGFALLSIFLLPAPLAVLFGILTLNEVKKYPHRSGKFWGYIAIGVGSIGTLILLAVIVATMAGAGK
jgi:hypothetical protein